MPQGFTSDLVAVTRGSEELQGPGTPAAHAALCFLFILPAAIDEVLERGREADSHPTRCSFPQYAGDAKEAPCARPHLVQCARIQPPAVTMLH